jgi:hypothetical protein
MSTQSQYAKEMADRFGGYFAAWTPGDPLALGDFGVLEGKAFTRIGNVDDIGITFAKHPDPTPEMIGPYKSAGKVSVAFKAAGAATIPNSTLTQVDAGFSVQFSGERAVFFLAENCLQPSIADQVKLGRDIISAFKDGRWSKSWHVITQLVEARSITVLISSSSNGVVDLKANGTINPTAGATDLAKVNLDLQVQFSRDMETQLVAQSGCTPMFKLSAVKKHLFGNPDFSVMKCIKPGADQLAKLPLAGITPKFLKDNPAMESYLSFGEVTD